MFKKNNCFIFTLLLLLSSSTFAFGQGNTAKIDFGSVEGSIYSNNYFGLKLTIPKKWQVQDDEIKKKIMALGRQKIDTGDKQYDKALDASLLRTLNLLTVFKHPVNKKGILNANFACVVENIKQFPTATTMDYVLAMKSLMQKTAIPYRFEPEIYPQSIGGKEFIVLPAQITSKGAIYHQTYYTTLMNGYALSFIITYSADEDLKTFDEMLKSVKFKG